MLLKVAIVFFFLADSTRRMSRQHSAIVALEKYLGLLVSCFVSYQLVQACKGPINRVNNSTPLLAPVYGVGKYLVGKR